MEIFGIWWNGNDGFRKDTEPYHWAICMPRGFPLLIATFALFAAGCGGNRWFDLQPKGEKFSVSMPASPTKREIERELAWGRLKVVEYATTTSEKMTFTLHYTDYPSSITEGKTADAMLDPGIDQTFSQYPHATCRSERTVQQGFPARNFTIVDPASRYTAFGRACLVGNRTYVVQAVMPSELSGRSEVRRFLDSFRVGSNIR